MGRGGVVMLCPSDDLVARAAVVVMSATFSAARPAARLVTLDELVEAGGHVDGGRVDGGRPHAQRYVLTGAPQRHRRPTDDARTR